MLGKGEEEKDKWVVKKPRQLQAESEKKVNCQRLEGKTRQRTITGILSEQIYGVVWTIQHLILQTLIFCRPPVIQLPYFNTALGRREEEAQR